MARRTRISTTLLEVPVAQRVSHKPPNADQNDVDRKAHSFEASHGRSSTVLGVNVYTNPVTAPYMRQNPAQATAWFLSSRSGELGANMKLSPDHNGRSSKIKIHISFRIEVLCICRLRLDYLGRILEASRYLLQTVCLGWLMLVQKVTFSHHTLLSRVRRVALCLVF